MKYVICKICGKQVKMINHLHLKVHGILNYLEHYVREQFGGDVLLISDDDIHKLKYNLIDWEHYE